MSEQDNSQQEGINPDTEAEIDIDLDSEVITEDSEEIIKKKDEAIRQLTARAKKAETLVKQFNSKSPEKEEKKEPISDEVVKTVQELKLAEVKRQFGYQNGLSPEETDYLFKLNPTPNKELLEDPFVKGGLEAIRKAKRVESNTPSMNSRSPRFEVPKKKDLTPEDKQEAFDKYMAGLKNRNS